MSLLLGFTTLSKEQEGDEMTKMSGYGWRQHQFNSYKTLLFHFSLDDEWVRMEDLRPQMSKRISQLPANAKVRLHAKLYPMPQKPPGNRRKRSS